MHIGAGPLEGQGAGAALEDAVLDDRAADEVVDILEGRRGAGEDHRVPALAGEGDLGPAGDELARDRQRDALGQGDRDARFDGEILDREVLCEVLVSRPGLGEQRTRSIYTWRSVVEPR